jgi:hypothetical protein
VIGRVPFQVPVEADSVCSSSGVPVTLGFSEDGLGALSPTGSVGGEVIVALPASLLAVTSTRSVVPTSVDLSL